MTPIPKRAETTWPQAVIFDLDGTLVDSAPDIAAAVNAALACRDIVIDPPTVRRFIGDGARKLIERVLAAHNIAAAAAEIERYTAAFTDCYQARPCTDSVVFDGAPEALDALRADGVRLAVCTNKPQTIAEHVIAQLALDRYVDVVIGAGAHGLKPDPDPLLACLDALSCDADRALYIGDMTVDRQAGHAAGLPVLLADFGYAAEPAAELGADGVLADWREIRNAIAAVHR